MGKLGTFSITLKSPNAIYFSGQNVTGNVTVDLNEPMKLRGTYFNNVLYVVVFHFYIYKLQREPFFISCKVILITFHEIQSSCFKLDKLMTLAILKTDLLR